MRLLGFALLLIMVSSCLATNRKVLTEIHGRKNRANRHLAEKEKDTFDGPGSSVNNHHNIPREDFNNFNGGTSTPYGGDNAGDDGGKF
ncbi:uncharacterized protein LOC131326276 [Rhododendron vialii]|uniref:uncharacterized protein LOC131326276 n=1 Tax=Rhododendron vialii TaxID=182163 RepID=UPI00265DAD8E|nr:uncharacterized protein LOC131326276 [Rhododendron vialii]